MSWAISWDLWSTRNKYRHRKENTISLLEAKSSNREIIEMSRLGAGEVKSRGSYLFAGETNKR